MLATSQISLLYQVSSGHIVNTMTLTLYICSGLDLGDRQALEQKYASADPPCLMDSSDGR